MPSEQETTPDHDLLVELRTEMKGLRDDVKDLANDTKDRLTRLEERKLDTQIFNDFLVDYKLERRDKEDRLRFMERYGWAAIGGAYVVMLLIGWYIMIHR